MSTPQQIRVDVTPRIKLLEGEQSPELHVWMSNHNSQTHRYDVVSATQPSFQHYDIGRFNEHLLFNVDYFVKVQNNKGLWCKMHKGRVSASVEHGVSTYELTCANDSECGVVGEVDISSDATFPSYVVDVEALHAHVNEMINSDYQIFNQITPSCDFVSRVHAPVWHTRSVPLPGQAYFFNLHETIAPTEAFYKSLIKAVMARRNISSSAVYKVYEAQVEEHGEDVSSSFHQLCSAVAEMATLPATYYPYVQDYIYEPVGATHSRHKAFESFDDLFQREAGDCEDMARAINQVFTGLQRGTFKDKMVRAFQNISNLYVPAACLGMVAAPAHTAAAGNGHAAHMYTKFFPKAVFYKKAGFPLTEASAWSYNLKTWVGEGTAPVQPFTDIESMKELCSEARCKYETANCTNTINGLVRVCRPTWSAREDRFYQKDVLCLTDTLLQSGKTNACAFSFVDDGKYGVAFDTVNANGKYSLVTHPPLSDNDIRLVQEIISFEHPPVKLDCKSISGWKKNKELRKLVDSLPKGKCKKDMLYEDYYLQRPADQSAETYANLSAQFKNSGAVRIEAVHEGWDESSHVVRFRLWGVSNNQ